MLHFGSQENAIQRYAYTGIGMAASVICLGASGFLNWRYGYSLGKTPFDGYIYGSAAAACDAMMAIAPFFFFAAVKNREAVRSLAAAVVWTVATAVAFVSAVSHASTNRLDTTGQRAVAAASYQDARTDVTQARKDRAFIPEHRPEAAVRAEMDKHKIKPQWSWTNECTDINGKANREYCATYQSLKAELGYAMNAAKLDERIADLTKRSDTLGSNTAVSSEADPGATTFRWVLSAFHIDLDLRSTQGVMTILVVVMILTIGGFGPYVSMAMFPVVKGARREKVSAPGADTTPSGPLLPDAPPLLRIAPPSPAGQDAGTAQPLPKSPVPVLSKAVAKISEEPKEAALNFYKWCVATGRAGGRQYTVSAIDRMYALRCEAESKIALDAKTFRKAFGRLPNRMVKKGRGPISEGKPTLYKINGGSQKQNAATPIDAKAARDTAQDVETAPANDTTPAQSEAPVAQAPAPGGGLVLRPPFGASKPEPVKGMAQLNRYFDLEAERAWVRQEKLQWQQRQFSKPRRHHRMMMARAA